MYADNTAPKDRDTARQALVDLVLEHNDEGLPLTAPDVPWSDIEPMLRTEGQLLDALLTMIREDVLQAREDGVSWNGIGTALGMPAETVALAYGGELIS